MRDWRDAAEKCAAKGLAADAATDGLLFIRHLFLKLIKLPHRTYQRGVSLLASALAARSVGESSTCYMDTALDAYRVQRYYFF